jgi:hypothetical protein
LEFTALWKFKSNKKYDFMLEIHENPLTPEYFVNSKFSVTEWARAFGETQQMLT